MKTLVSPTGSPTSWASSEAVRRSMTSNRGVNTTPELRLRRELFKSGLRYRVGRPIRLKGGNVRPDIVFSSIQLAVFLDGCFWHSCPIHKTAPRTNAVWWRAKLNASVARDSRQRRAMRMSGWTVIRVWEHENEVAAASRVIGRIDALRSAPQSPRPRMSARTYSRSRSPRRDFVAGLPRR